VFAVPGPALDRGEPAGCAPAGRARWFAARRPPRAAPRPLRAP